MAEADENTAVAEQQSPPDAAVAEQQMPPDAAVAEQQSPPDAAVAEQQSPPDAAVEVAEPQLPEAADGPKTKGPAGQVDILLDSTMSISACLGEVDIQVRELLGLTGGSVLKVNRQIGEPIDLYMRGIKFATGYLVVIGEQLGVRIKEILPPPADKPPAC